MSKTLQEYNRKRRFEETPEPTGGTSGGEPIYVIQKHHARRLHWDLRLELDGVLLSWAVPKEPSMDPTVKRLAVHVEDHPLDYATFEGMIPKGNYGAGKVEIWDQGIWRHRGDAAQQLEDGKLEFTVLGNRLRGKFALIKMKPKKGEEDEDNWLLIKEREDDFGLLHADADLSRAKASEMPIHLEHQLCTRKPKTPSGADWLHEIKWDGYRAFATVKDGDCAFTSRNQNTFEVPHLQKVLASLEDCILDGELVGFDEDGKSSFRIIQDAFGSKNTNALSYVAFDLLYADGKDLRRVPLIERKRRLEQIVAEINDPLIRYSAHADGSAVQLFDQACRAGMEGLVSKKADSVYLGGRHSTWVKVRCEQRVRAVIGGYTLLKDHVDAVGSLLVGIRNARGDLLYSGKVGTGFSQKLRHDLFQLLSKSTVKTQPFSTSPDAEAKRGAKWVKPTQEVEVEFASWTESGILRHSKLIEVFDSEKPEPKAKFNVPSQITSADRVLDPESGLTKGDIAAYYQEMAETIWPWARNRVLAGVRCPEGISGQCFFQKHWLNGLGRSVQKVAIGTNEDEQDYLALKSPSGLIDFAQMGFIEFHLWGSQIKHLEKPDQIIFDLDPGPGLDWSDIVNAGLFVKNELESTGLVCFAKVTGGKGLHVVCPIKPELEWNQVKAFCKGIAQSFAKHDPSRFVATMSKSARNGKIYIDYLRNGRGATAIAPYSVRSRPGLPVACPVTWMELTTLESPNQFSIFDAIDRAKHDLDPWDHFEKSRRSLLKLGVSENG